MKYYNHYYKKKDTTKAKSSKNNTASKATMDAEIEEEAFTSSGNHR